MFAASFQQIFSFTDKFAADLWYIIWGYFDQLVITSTIFHVSDIGSNFLVFSLWIWTISFWFKKINNFEEFSGCEVTTFLELSQIKSLDFKLISCKLQNIWFVITVCRCSSEGTTESLEQSYGKCGNIIWSCKHKGKTVKIFNVWT